MATVDKDFRVKHGLVVEGTTATVNGEDMITTGSSTDDLPEGSTNQYFTSQRAIDAVASEITTEVTTAIDALTTDDIEEGATNLYYTTARAKGDAADLLTNATLTNIAITGNEDGLTITAENGVADSDTDDLTEGTTNLYFTNQRALDATASAYDPAGSAASAQSAAESYADGLAVNYDPAGAAASAQSAAESYADGLAVNYDPAGSAATAESNANTYTDTALEDYTPTSSLDTTVGGYGYLKSADLSGYATETYVNDAVDALVDGAPGLLDTLNEIAAAINDDENYATTVTTALAGKQGTLTAGDNISIVSDTISVTGLDAADISDFNTAALSATASAYDAAGAAAAAQTAAESYADGLAVNYEPAGAAQSAVDALDTDDIEEGTTNLYFTNERAVIAISGEDIFPNSVSISNASKNVATIQSVETASTITALYWAKADFRSAKLLVQAQNTTDSQVSEILVTLDSSDNVAITEFAMVQTNEEIATATVDVSGTDVRVRITTLGASTDVAVFGTLLATVVSAPPPPE